MININNDQNTNRQTLTRVIHTVQSPRTRYKQPGLSLAKKLTKVEKKTIHLMIHKIQLHFFYQMHNMQDGKSTKFMNTDYMCDIYIAVL